MTTLHLIRHARHTLQDVILVARTCDAPLSSQGRADAAHLARQVGPGLAAIYSSPRRRALETARAIAQVAKTPLSIEPAFDELDFGEWSGRTYSMLDEDPRWRDWNAARASARCPGGESMADVLDRVSRGFCAIAAPETGAVAIVSHAEPIRAVVLHCSNRSFNDFAAVEAPTASFVTILRSPDGRLSLQQSDAPA